MLRNILFKLLFIGTGIFLGVIFSNWTYFKFESAINVAEIISILITSIVGIYVAYNIQLFLNNRETGKALFIDEMKKFYSSLDQLESWLDEQVIPFEEGKIFFKKKQQSLKLFRNIFSEVKVCEYKKLDSLFMKFAVLKRNATNNSPIGDKIILSTQQARNLEDQLSRIKSETLKLCFSNK